MIHSENLEVCAKTLCSRVLHWRVSVEQEHYHNPQCDLEKDPQDGKYLFCLG